MKGKLTTIIAGTILAVTGATLPASAIKAQQHTFDLPGTTSNTIGQQQAEVSFGKEQNILLAANNTKKKGAEHTSNKSPSNKEKHEKGQKAKKQQASNQQLQKAKGKDSKASKDSLRTNGSKSRGGTSKK
ncbi:hypothetical protein HW132_31880 [Brasilonema sp. CT11]|nr:hypothetical protein [Brasilonema sp. CT11]